MTKTPPPVSVVSKTTILLRSHLTPELLTAYREAWFDTLDSLKGSGIERSSRSADKDTYSNPTHDTVSTNEPRRKSLLRASEKLERALELVRDAKGLIDYAGGSGSSGLKDGQTQSFTKGEMDSLNGERPPRNRVRAG